MDPPHRSFFSNFSLSKFTKLDSSSSLFFSSSCTFCSTTWKTRVLHFLLSFPADHTKTQMMSDLLNLERQGLHIAFVIPLCPTKRRRKMVRMERRRQLQVNHPDLPSAIFSTQLACQSQSQYLLSLAKLILSCSLRSAALFLSNLFLSNLVLSNKCLSTSTIPAPPSSPSPVSTPSGADGWKVLSLNSFAVFWLVAS